MDHITGRCIVQLMQRHGKTIGGVAASMGITQKRVRDVRANGVVGMALVQDWVEAITGDSKAGWAIAARSYV